MSTVTVDDKPALTVVPDTTEDPRPEVSPESSNAADSSANAGRMHTRARDLVFRSAKSLRPPDFWAHDLPALAKDWRHAKWGEQVPHESLTRIVYCLFWWVICLPPTAVFTFLAWAHKRPARMAGFWVTVWALWQVAPVRAVLGFVIHWNVPALATHVLHIGG